MTNKVGHSHTPSLIICKPCLLAEAIEAFALVIASLPYEMLISHKKECPYTWNTIWLALINEKNMVWFYVPFL